MNVRRETWVYVFVFVAVVAGGVAWILPRFTGERSSTRRTEAPAPAPAPEAPAAPPTPAPPAWRTVRVAGADGLLRGPMKDVVGADVEPVDPADAPTRRLRVRPRAARVAFGAAGHLWVDRDAATLADGERIVLPAAAPPVVVRVREADGAPAAGVPVRVLPATPGPERRTDRGGAVVVDDAPPGLVVIEVGGSERRGPSLRVEPGRERDVTAVLEPAWRVRGRAVDAAGRPVAGARVTGHATPGAVGRESVAAEDGTFAWTGPAVPALALRVAADGFAEVWVEAAPPAKGAPGTDVGDVTLAPGGRVLGTVRSAAIEPDARVEIEPEVAAIVRELFGADAVLGAVRTVPVAADGSFRAEGLPLGLPLRLTVRGAGEPVDELREATPEGTGREVAVPSGRTLELRVTDGATGAAVAGIALLVSRRPLDGDAEVAGDVRAVTDAEGGAVLRGLAEGSVFVRGYAPGRRSLLRKVDLPASGPVRLALEAALTDPSRRVAGTVVDEEGKPLAGVTVRAAGVSGTTDDGGAFALEGVESLAPRVVVAAAYEPGPLPPSARPTGRAGSAREEVAPGGPPLRLVLARGAGLRFRALDGMDDAPVVCVHAVLRTDDGQTVVDRVVTTVDGVVAWDDLPSRGATLSLHAPGLRFTTTTPLEPGKTRDLGDVRLARGLRVRGRVVDEKGIPLPNVRIAALDEGWIRAHAGDPAPRRDLDLRHVRTASDGTFALEGLDPSRPVALAAWAPGRAVAARRAAPGDLAAASDAPLEVRLKPAGHLVLHVTETRSGRPVFGAALDLEDARNGAHFLDLVQRAVLGGRVASDEDRRAASDYLLHEHGHPGDYHVGPIEAGPYEVWLEHPLYRPWKTKLTVFAPGEVLTSTRAQDVVPEAPGTLALNVELEPVGPP